MSSASSSPNTFDHVRDAGIAWMNRGHQLRTRGDPASLTEAIDAYGQAISILRSLPVSQNPAWVVSLAAAFMNRGQLLHRVHGLTQATEALQSYAESISLLRGVSEGDNPWPRRNLAGTLLNRALLLLDLNETLAASDVTREALALITPHEQNDPVDADLSLKIRRALCDAIGRQIVAPQVDQNALASEASDLVDEGLALIRLWTGRGAQYPRDLAMRLFHYGAQLYRVHQPHFLAEFIAEHLPADDADFRTMALEIVDVALADQARRQGFLTVGDPSSERHVQTSRDLSDLRSRLIAAA